MEEAPLLILNAKAVMALRKPSIREGQIHGGDGVCVGREEKCCICVTETIDRPMPIARSD